MTSPMDEVGKGLGTLPERSLELRRLLERVEGATGADREIDAEIAVVFNVRPEWLARSDGRLWVDHKSSLDEPVLRFCDARTKPGPGNPPAGPYHTYTGSLDATLALVNRVFPGWGYDVTFRAAWGNHTACVIAPERRAVPHVAAGKNAALALLAALLRALIETNGEG